MQVSVTPTEGLTRRMTVELPADRIDQEVAQRLNSMKGRVRISGFRPGKVPFKVIQQRYGAQVRHEVETELMRSAFVEAVRQENLHPAGVPQLEQGNAADGGLEFTATFEVYPEIKVELPKKFEVERPMVEVSDQDLDAMIEKLRTQKAGWEAVERAAADGDQVIIDFLGKLDGEAFQGGEGKAYPLVLGSGQFISGFEEQLVGVKAGDSVDVNVTFPEEYQSKELAGKAAVFEVSVQTVNAPKLPAIDDAEFMASFGVTDGNVETLKADVRSSMEKELEQAIKGKVKAQVLEKLLDANPLEMPTALVEDEIKQMLNQARQRMGIPAEQSPAISDEIRKTFEPGAKRRVALGLLVGEVIREQGFQADADKVRAEIETLAQSYEDSAAVINWYYEDKSRLSGVEALVLEDQVVEWLLSQAKIQEVSKQFDEIMGERSAA